MWQFQPVHHIIYVFLTGAFALADLLGDLSWQKSVGIEADHFLLFFVNPDMRLWLADFSFVLAVSAQRTSDFFKVEHTQIIDIWMKKVRLPEITPDESVNHDKFIIV